MTSLYSLQRRLLKRTFFDLLRFAGWDELTLKRHGRAGRALILSLHGVSPDPNPYWPALDPTLFRELVSWLRRRTTITLLRDLPRLAASDVKRPLVVLSFDDGYQDFVEYIHPILDELGIRANVNIIGESVETGEPPEIVRFCDLLDAAPVHELRALRLRDFNVALAGEDPLEKERFGAATSTYLKALDPAERGALLTDLELSLPRDGNTRKTEMMREADVVAMADAGHEVGLHSYCDESMALVSDQFFERDLERCTGVLTRLGLETKVYSFPNGSYRPSQVEVLKRRGFDRVLLVGERPTWPTSEVHTRLTVRGHSLSEIVGRSVGHGARRSGSLNRA
ncbi:MAG: polysaccharide deacetylase family protein [Solirubrobacterales bacterium]